MQTPVTGSLPKCPQKLEPSQVEIRNYEFNPGFPWGSKEPNYLISFSQGLYLEGGEVKSKKARIKSQDFDMGHRCPNQEFNIRLFQKLVPLFEEGLEVVDCY